MHELNQDERDYVNKLSTRMAMASVAVVASIVLSVFMLMRNR